MRLRRRRRVVDGVAEPLVSGGEVVRGDDGQPLAIRRYSDTLIPALLKARRPEKFKDRAVVERTILPTGSGRRSDGRSRHRRAEPSPGLLCRYPNW